jgi:hypothetical protein
LVRILFWTAGCFVLAAALGQFGEAVQGRPADAAAFVWLAIFAAPWTLLAGYLFLPTLWKAVPVRPTPKLEQTDPQVDFRPGPLRYPALAQWRRQPGWVLVEIAFDERGRYRSHIVEDESPPRQFRRAARRLLASSQARRMDGEPGPERVRTVVRFAIPELEPQAKQT